MKQTTLNISFLMLSLVFGLSNVRAQGDKGIDIIPYFGYTFGGKVK